MKVSPWLGFYVQMVVMSVWGIGALPIIVKPYPVDELQIESSVRGMKVQIEVPMCKETVRFEQALCEVLLFFFFYLIAFWAWTL